ncbi:ATPase, T2SS/T4P/T4SS family [Bacteriovorax sp. Seq25_V]|uniref:ATPase, T2SS/T4P/T4SS family n=1 Tax=Bacteriovorax sp. Seq25_V TaxID=1201288 RepID=UPI000389E7E0|nr:ATPase, T2SS/T4P/T4SS family [Bacteriovorax sp. Seq25_V]EQC43721.1 type II/IV secretion system protein [Bacteriovorax sp. Seq25_V]
MKDTNLEKVLGKLYSIFNDPNVDEIFIDSYKDIYYTENSKIVELKDIFSNREELENFTLSLINYFQVKITEETETLNLSFDDYRSVNIILSTINKTGPILNFMKLPQKTFGWEDYLKHGAIDEEGKNVIEGLLKENKNIIIAGPVGSGKTTLLNLVVNSIPLPNRVITIEKIRNLIIDRKMTARLIAESSNSKGVRKLIEAVRRMRADYIVLDDIHGSEVVDYINLINEGHSSVSLIGADNIFDALRRIEIFALNDYNAKTLDDIRYSISTAFDYIVFQEKLENGKRKVTKIGKVIFDGEKPSIELVYNK